MNLTFVRKYRKILRKTDGIFFRNPLISLGLALPLAVIPTYSLSGAVAVSLTMLMCFVPTVFIASFIGGGLESRIKIIFYPLISCLLLLPASNLVLWISPLIFDTLGIYFSLICVNSMLAYAVDKVQGKTPIKALGFALRQWLGATLAAVFFAIVRELISSGSIWGVPVATSLPKLPAFQMAFGGFILLGFFAAGCRFVHRSILYFAIKAGKNKNSEEGGQQK